MTTPEWDADQAVTRGRLDEDLEGCFSIDRYGVVGIEELEGEPLSVALGQEEADAQPAYAFDDQWAEVEGDADAPLFDGGDHSPEERALHVVTP